MQKNNKQPYSGAPDQIGNFSVFILDCGFGLVAWLQPISADMFDIRFTSRRTLLLIIQEDENRTTTKETARTNTVKWTRVER